MRFGDVFPLAVPPRHPLREALATTLAGLDGLHGWPKLPPLGVRTEPMMAHHEGLFDPAFDVYGVRIADNCGFPSITLLHEIGHALDHTVLGGGTRWATTSWASTSSGDQSDAAWLQWLGAVKASKTYRVLARQRREYAVPSVRAYCVYLMQIPELFARTYAQWAAERLADSPAASELRVLQKPTKAPAYWQNDEFTSIAAAFEHLLQRNEWF